MPARRWARQPAAWHLLLRLVSILVDAQPSPDLSKLHGPVSLGSRAEPPPEAAAQIKHAAWLEEHHRSPLASPEDDASPAAPLAAYARRYLADSGLGTSKLTAVPGLSPFAPAYLLVIMEVHGNDIQPFGYDDRVDFLVAMDDAILHINLTNIELLAVEEFLPVAGPSAESLMNLYGNNGVYSAPKQPAQAAASPTSPGTVAAQELAASEAADAPRAAQAGQPLRTSGRRLLQQLLLRSSSDPSVVTPSHNVSEPIVRVTLRLTTTVGNLSSVDYELHQAVANSTAPMLEDFRSKGHNVSEMLLDSVTASYTPLGGPSIAPAPVAPPVVAQPAAVPGAAPLPVPPAPTLLHDGRVFVAPASQQATSASTRATTIGVSVGIGVLLVVGLAAASLVVIYRKQRDDLKLGAEAGQSRAWAVKPTGPDPIGFLGVPRKPDEDFDNPLDTASGLFSIREDAQEVQRNPSNYSTTSRDALLLPGQPSPTDGSPRRNADAGRARLEHVLALQEGYHAGDCGHEFRKSGSGGTSVSNNTEGWGTGGELVSMSDLQFSRIIGEGSFGRVYLGKWQETTVAIKLLSQPLMPGQRGAGEHAGLGPSLQKLRSSKSTSVLDELRKETQLMSVLRHPNIVMFLGACSNPPCMITEYCARGSLLDILTRARECPAAAAELGWSRRLNMALEAAKGMLYLHSRVDCVLHRDLKSANLLVDKHWRVKVADFNLSRVMHASTVVSSVSATNPRWMAPEVLAGKRYDCAADVYSFGIILWELLTWQIPWEDLGPWQVVILVVDQQQRPELPQDLMALPGRPLGSPGPYLDLMQQCWATDPAQRPSFERVISALRNIIEAETHSANAPGMPGQQQGSAV